MKKLFKSNSRNSLYAANTLEQSRSPARKVLNLLWFSKPTKLDFLLNQIRSFSFRGSYGASANTVAFLETPKTGI